MCLEIAKIGRYEKLQMRFFRNYVFFKIHRLILNLLRNFSARLHQSKKINIDFQNTHFALVSLFGTGCSHTYAD
jgi:hypothetical protein